MTTHTNESATSAYIEPQNVNGVVITGTLDEYHRERPSLARRARPRLVLTPATVLAYMREDES